MSNNQLTPDFNLYRFKVSAGIINGASDFDAFGEFYTAAATTSNDIWLGPTKEQPGPVSAGFRPNIISTSDEDGAGTLTGILDMRVYYLDTAGDLQFEDVTLAGLTQVDMVATDVMFIQCAHAISINKAVGDIDIRNGTTVYKRIAATKARCLSTKRMVPKGKCLFIEEWGASAETKLAGRSTIRLEATSLQGVITTPFLELDSITAQNNGLFKKGHPRGCYPELSLIKCTVDTTAEGYASAGWSGWVQDA